MYCLVEDPEIRKGILAARALGQVRLVRRFHRTDARNSILLYRNTAQVLPLRLMRLRDDHAGSNHGNLHEKCQVCLSQV